MLVPPEAPPAIATLLKLAERDARRAVAELGTVAHAYNTADTLAQAWLSYANGWVLLRRTDLMGARQHLDKAVHIFEEVALTRVVLHCRRALLITKMLSGADLGLQAEWDMLVMAYIAHGAPIEAARSQIQQAAHLNALGRHAEARALLAPIQTLLYTDGTLDDLARLCRITAIAAGYMEEWNEALAQLDAAIHYFSCLEYPLDIAKCIFERGTLLERQEHYDSALTELTRAYDSFVQLDDQLYIAFCQKALGLVQSRLGRFDQAIALTVAAQRIFHTFGRRDQVAACDLNLGNIAYYGGRFELAVASYYRAQNVFDSLGIQHDSLLAQRNQAMVLRAQGQPAQTLERLIGLEQLAATRENAVELANIYRVQAEALNDLGQYSTAIERLDRAQAILVSAGKPAIVAQCLLEQGWIAIAQERFDLAVAYFIAAQPELVRRPIHLWRLYYGLGRCAQQQGDSGTALAHYARASDLLADLRSNLYSEHISSGLFQQARHFFNHAVRLAVAEHDLHAVLMFVEQQHALILHQPPAALPASRMPEDLELTYAQQRAVLRKLVARRATPEEIDEALNAYLDLLLRLRHHVPITDRSHRKSFDLRALRTQLTAAYPTGWIALVYVEYDSQLLTITIDEQKLSLTETQIDSTLHQLLSEACLPECRRFTYLDLSRLLDPRREHWQNLRELATYLIPEGVRRRLQADHRLLIAPSVRLHGLPWSALRIDDDWLCERVILQITPTLGLWETLSLRRTVSSESLLVGCAHFGDRAAPLPEVMAELDAVAARCPGPITRLHETMATHQRLQQMNAEQQLSRYRLIHIASHAQIVASRGLLAHIKLWDDDLLYNEIVDFVLNGAIVVLSACEGDLGEVLPGEEVLSLCRAFLAAGARDVIASLWSVDDRLTVAFMRLLYDGLARGLDAPSAVNYAQRWMLAQPSSDNAQQDLNSPLIWAAFHVLGAGTFLEPCLSATPKGEPPL